MLLLLALYLLIMNMMMLLMLIFVMMMILLEQIEYFGMNFVGFVDRFVCGFIVGYYGVGSDDVHKGLLVMVCDVAYTNCDFGK